MDSQLINSTFSSTASTFAAVADMMQNMYTAQPVPQMAPIRKNKKTKSTAKCSVVQKKLEVLKLEFNIVADFINTAPPPSADPAVLDHYVKNNRRILNTITKFHVLIHKDLKKATKVPAKYAVFHSVLAEQHRLGNLCVGQCRDLARIEKRARVLGA